MNSSHSPHVENTINLELFDTLQRGAIQYFMVNINSANELVSDSTWEGAPDIIAAVRQIKNSLSAQWQAHVAIFWIICLREY
jgi:hypothetical protein